MCRLTTTDLPPAVSSAARARRWVAEHLGRWELGGAADVATLMVSELVANAVVHARSGPGLVLAVADGVIELGVTDNEPRLPKANRPPLPASGGRGDEPVLFEGGRRLLLVEALANEWA